MQAMTRLRARLRAESTPDDMQWTWSQLTTLSRIVQLAPATATELATAEHVRRQSMAETLAVLRAGGLVASRPDPEDARKLQIYPTRRGIALSTTIPAARETWLTAAIDRILDDDERQILVKASAILSRIAEAEGKRTG